MLGAALFSVHFLAAAVVVVVVAPPVPEDEFFERKMLLPALLKDPLVALVGESCYVSLVEDFNIFTDVRCLKYAISKGLGLGIVVGGSIVKIPQILTIVAKRSARGLSLASYVLETMSCCIAFAYNWRQGNPFSTYGETCFLTIQNIIISLLILYYARRTAGTVLVALFYAALLQCLTTREIMPSWMVSSLYAATTIPLNLASKVPQIYANYVNKSIGQLSIFAVLNYFAGTTARVFTTMTELDDPLMLAGNVLASVLNGVLVIQVFMYWGKKMEDEKPTKAD